MMLISAFCGLWKKENTKLISDERIQDNLREIVRGKYYARYKKVWQKGSFFSGPKGWVWKLQYTGTISENEKRFRDEELNTSLFKKTIEI